MPKKPNTTDGMPANTSIIGLSRSRAQPGATSRTKTAVASPNGSAMAIAVTVTTTEPRISGSVPNRSKVGYQRAPKRLAASTVKNAGNPSRSRKRKISRTKATVEKPKTRISVSTANSPQRAYKDLNMNTYLSGTNPNSKTNA